MRPWTDSCQIWCVEIFHLALPKYEKKSWKCWKNIFDDVTLWCSIVLKSINLNSCMWHISKEQLILFPLVPFLYHVCHAWPSTLPLKMTIMSLSTFCKFCELDKRVIAKQCNGVAAENVTSHARRSFSFLEIWTTGYLELLLVILRIIWSYLTWINGCLGNIIIWLWWNRTCRICRHRCQLSSEISGGYAEDVGA